MGSSVRAYIGTPCSQMQAHLVAGLDVLVSFAARKGTWLDNYLPTFGRLLIDSGAYSVLKSGVRVDLGAYVAWAKETSWADAWAGLDDISGDWRQSLKNYESGGFPTYHDTDPPELLPDLIELAWQRGKWIGIGMLPPRTGRVAWLLETLDRIPSGLHVHGWALGRYAGTPGLHSFDSTHAWLEWMKYRKNFPWLTPAECMEIAVKKVSRKRFGEETA